MPYRKLPNSVPSVIRLLKAARDEWKNTVNPADRAIAADQWAQLDDADPNSLLSRLLKEASDVDLAQAAQAPLTTALAQAAAKLTTAISHFHQVLDLGIARGTFAAGARSYYGRDVTATSIPDLSSYAAVAEAADNIVKGEAARQTAEGAAFVPMALPSASEVEALLEDFNTLDSQSDQASVNTDKQRADLNAVYPAAQALAVDICDTVEFFYRKEPDAATLRSKAARWGVVYVYDNGTTTPPASGPAPAPAAGH